MYYCVCRVFISSANFLLSKFSACPLCVFITAVPITKLFRGQWRPVTSFFQTMEARDLFFSQLPVEAERGPWRAVAVKCVKEVEQRRQLSRA